MKCRRGHAMLELAVSSAVMISCLAGTFQFGYTFYVYNQLVTAVGNGGRYAALRTYRAASAEDVEKGAQAIRNMVVYGDPQPDANTQPAGAQPAGAQPIVANLTPDHVNVHWVMDEKGTPSAVNITIHDFKIDAVFKTFTFSGRPGVEFPFVGRYAPSEHER